MLADCSLLLTSTFLLPILFISQYMKEILLKSYKMGFTLLENLFWSKRSDADIKMPKFVIN